MQLNWSTGAEIQNLGFNVFRSRSGDFATAIRVNGAMIPSKAFGSQSGASYSFLDKTAVAGRPYNYWLQDVPANGQLAESAGYTGVHSLGRGIWCAPKALAMSPLDAARVWTQQVNFLANYKDADGDLAAVYLLIANTPDMNAGLAVRYDLQTGLLSTYDARLGWKAGAAPKTKVNISSAYGRLAAYGSWVTMLNDGDVARVNFRVKLWDTMIGTKNVYTMAEDTTGNTTGWVLKGAWTILPVE